MSTPVPPDAAGFLYRRRVQFADTDMAGIVHFSAFFRYMEEAEHAMWREAGLSIAPAGATYAFPRVSAACDYHSPLRFEDECQVRVTIAEATARTIRYVCAITRDDTSIATGTLTTVCVRKVPGEPLRAMEIPGEIRARLGI